MTGAKNSDDRKTKKGELFTLALSVVFTGTIFICALFLSDELSEYVKEGLLLSAGVIIPSVFPFLIITDLCIRYIRFERIGFLRRIFEKLFNVNGCALSVFVCGILCGFPVGAKLALILYENGKISKCECERLFAFANNASPGYVICAVGFGMRSSLKDGIALYLCMVISAVLCGIIVGINKEKSKANGFISWQSYSFTSSTKNAVSICTSIAGFVTVFGIISGLFEKFLCTTVIPSLVLPILEIGNAGLYLSDLCIFNPDTTFALTSFAISFSGLCVYCQALSLLPENSNISTKKYLPTKLMQGVISMLLAFLYAVLFK